MTIKDYRYVYNPEQALFYMQHEFIPEDMKPNGRTKCIYYKFKDCKELQETYELWINRKARKQTVLV